MAWLWAFLAVLGSGAGIYLLWPTTELVWAADDEEPSTGEVADSPATLGHYYPAVLRSLADTPIRELNR